MHASSHVEGFGCDVARTAVFPQMHDHAATSLRGTILQRLKLITVDLQADKRALATASAALIGEGQDPYSLTTDWPMRRTGRSA